MATQVRHFLGITVDIWQFQTVDVDTRKSIPLLDYTESITWWQQVLWPIMDLISSSLLSDAASEQRIALFIQWTSSPLSSSQIRLFVVSHGRFRKVSATITKTEWELKSRFGCRIKEWRQQLPFQVKIILSGWTSSPPTTAVGVKRQRYCCIVTNLLSHSLSKRHREQKEPAQKLSHERMSLRSYTGELVIHFWLSLSVFGNFRIFTPKVQRWQA